MTTNRACTIATNHTYPQGPDVIKFVGADEIRAAYADKIRR